MPERQEFRKPDMMLASEPRQTQEPEHREAEEHDDGAREPSRNIAPRRDKPAEEPREQAKQYENNGEPQHERDSISHHATASSGNECQVSRHDRKRTRSQEHQNAGQKSSGREQKHIERLHSPIVAYRLRLVPSPLGLYSFPLVIRHDEFVVDAVYKLIVLRFLKAHPRRTRRIPPSGALHRRSCSQPGRK